MQRRLATVPSTVWFYDYIYEYICTILVYGLFIFAFRPTKGRILSRIKAKRIGVSVQTARLFWLSDIVIGIHILL